MGEKQGRDSKGVWTVQASKQRVFISTSWLEGIYFPKKLSATGDREFKAQNSFRYVSKKCSQ